MRKMMGKVARENWNCPCCYPYNTPRKVIRQREKRQWRKDQQD